MKPAPLSSSVDSTSGEMRLVRQIVGNTWAVSATEFALLCPVLLLVIIGSFDMTQMIYANAMLRGAVEEAARSSSLEFGNAKQADQHVLDIMAPILPGVSITSSRVSYYDFADIDRAEKWNDRNLNGTCDGGEGYTDENGSGSWENNVGKDGNGGAGDVVIYTVQAKYTPVFRVPFSQTLGGERTLKATGIRKNQPFTLQSQPGVRAGTCV